MNTHLMTMRKNETAGMCMLVVFVSDGPISLLRKKSGKERS